MILVELSVSNLQARLRPSGYTSIELLVGMIVAIIIALVAYPAILYPFKLAKSIELTSDRLSLRKMLFERIDCQKTLATAACNGSTAIPLLKADGSPVFPGGVFGNFVVKAHCTAGKIIARAARPLRSSVPFHSTQATDFSADPLTGRIATWQDAKSNVFPEGYVPCKGTNAVAVVDTDYVQVQAPPEPISFSVNVKVEEPVTVIMLGTAASHVVTTSNMHVRQSVKMEINTVECKYRLMFYGTLDRDMISHSFCMASLAPSPTPYTLKVTEDAKISPVGHGAILNWPNLAGFDGRLISMRYMLLKQ